MATKTVAVPEGESSKDRWNRRETEIVHQGNRIILPNDPEAMSLPDAASILMKKHEEQMLTMDVFEYIEGFPLDAAIAFTRAMRQLHGWATAVPTPGWFGGTPPDIVTVRTGPNPGDATQVIIGSFAVPGLEFKLTTGIGSGPNGLLTFYVSSKVRKKNQHQVMQIVELARAILSQESIYKGKALRFKADGRNVAGAIEPEFIQTDHVREEELIFSKDVQNHLNVSLWTPIEKTIECMNAGIPLKRGILLEGPYGCGKTLTAAVTSKKCVDNEWTFISLDDPNRLHETLEFAKRFLQPCVVFAEDIDRADGMEGRGDKANTILNTIDGILTKNAQVIVVLTTNHKEKINQAMLRPGRLDAVVSVAPPDATAVERLLRLYARGRIDTSEDLTDVAEMIADGKNIPATVREIVERSKLAMIAEGRETISSSALRTTYFGMKTHLELLNKPSDKKLTPAEQLGKSFEEVVKKHAGGMMTGDGESVFEELEGQYSHMHEHLISIENTLNDVRGKLQNIGGGDQVELLSMVSAIDENVDYIKGHVMQRRKQAA